MPICEYCGKELSDNSKFCDNCGKPIVRNFPDGGGGASIICPVCKLSRAKKVSEIIRQETNQVSGSIPVSSTYSDSNGKVHSVTSYQGYYGIESSRLAQDLVPPKQPTLPVRIGAGTKWLLVPLILFSLYVPLGLGLVITTFYFLIFSPSEFDPLTLFTIPGAILVWLIMFFMWRKWAKRRKREIDSYPGRLATAEKEMADYHRAMENWNRLYYCYTDGNVFIPGLNTYAPIEKMLDYIYQSPLKL